jgi:mycothiol synthase
MPSLPSGYSVRPAVDADAAEIADLIDAHARSEIGERWTTVDEVRDDLTAPGRDPAIETAVVRDDRFGGTVAFVQLFADIRPYRELFALAGVHPDHRGRGLGTYLLELVEERAREKLAADPPQGNVALRVSRFLGNDAAAALFEKLGFSYARTFLLMRMSLDEPSSPEIPDGIGVTSFDPASDAKPVYEALSEAFEDHWGAVFPPFDVWRHYSIDGEGAGFDPGLWVVARDGDEVVGVACSRDNTARSSVGFVEELGVRRVWRNRGIGLALLLASFEAFRRKGLSTAELSVDADSLTGATRLYEKAGMRIAFGWETWGKTLEPSQPA